MADPIRVGLSAWTEIGWVEIDSATAVSGTMPAEAFSGTECWSSTSVIRIQTPA
jgi:hypothetical protein